MKYFVHVIRTRNSDIEVEADSKEEAIAKAKESCTGGEDTEYTSVFVVGHDNAEKHEYVIEIMRSQSKEFTVHATNILDAEEEAKRLAQENNNWEEPYDYDIGYEEVDGEEI